ncbi:hypothetical protein [Rhodococcus sp. ACPA1]|uniref:hypothetical protein n=1 Tax=Rhodococcus sp. ACPA1 TaxID=2028572 RepID=UPI001C527382|nr:hypothetical protein [Rhodococcus sp. ACPA1]
MGIAITISGLSIGLPWATELVTRLEREHYTIHIADIEAYGRLPPPGSCTGGSMA